jgi:hypothetical protein
MLMYAGLSPFGLTADRKITGNALLSTITAAITDKSLQFDDGSLVATVSAAGKGKVIYNDTLKAFQFSADGAAYANFGTPGTPLHSVQFNSPLGSFAGNAGFTYDPTANPNAVIIPQANNETGLHLRESTASTNPDAEGFASLLVMSVAAGSPFWAQSWKNDVANHTWSNFFNEIHDELSFQANDLTPTFTGGVVFSPLGGVGVQSPVDTNTAYFYRNAADHASLGLSADDVTGVTPIITFTALFVGIGQLTPAAQLDILSNDPGVQSLLVTAASANPAHPLVVFQNSNSSILYQFGCNNGSGTETGDSISLRNNNADCNFGIGIVAEDDGAAFSYLNLYAGSGFTNTLSLLAWAAGAPATTITTQPSSGVVVDNGAGGLFVGAGQGDLNLFAGGVQSANIGLLITAAGQLVLQNTVTPGGTTGNQTINQPSGTVNFAAAASSLTVTNSLCTANSIVLCTVLTNDTTAAIKNVVPANGSFVIRLVANTTGETSVGFLVINL